MKRLGERLSGKRAPWRSLPGGRTGRNAAAAARTIEAKAEKDWLKTLDDERRKAQRQLVEKRHKFRQQQKLELAPRDDLHIKEMTAKTKDKAIDKHIAQLMRRI